MALTELQLLKTLVQKFQFDPLNAEFFLVRKGEGQSFVVMEALVKLAHSKVVSTSALFGGGGGHLECYRALCLCLCMLGGSRQVFASTCGDLFSCSLCANGVPCGSPAGKSHLYKVPGGH